MIGHFSTVTREIPCIYVILYRIEVLFRRIITSVMDSFFLLTDDKTVITLFSPDAKWFAEIYGCLYCMFIEGVKIFITSSGR